MALFLNTASNAWLQQVAPPISAYPFTVLLWLKQRTTGVKNAFSVTLNAAGNTIAIYSDTSWQFYDNVAGATPLGSAATANVWQFFALRYISSTNRRGAILDTNLGTISHAQLTTSMAITSIEGIALGANYGSPTANLDGWIGEYCLIGANIQADGDVLSEVLLRQLAYRGPFSVPSIKKDILEYRSFFSRVNTDLPSEVYWGAKGRQTWTNNNGVTIDQHVPLPGNYERLQTTKRKIFVYAPDVVSGDTETIGTVSAGATVIGRARSTANTRGTVAAAATVAGVGSSSSTAGGLVGTKTPGGLLVNVGTMMGH